MRALELAEQTIDTPSRLRVVGSLEHTFAQLGSAALPAAACQQVLVPKGLDGAFDHGIEQWRKGWRGRTVFLPSAIRQGIYCIESRLRELRQHEIAARIVHAQLAN